MKRVTMMRNVELDGLGWGGFDCVYTTEGQEIPEDELTDDIIRELIEREVNTILDEMGRNRITCIVIVQQDPQIGIV